MPKKRHFKTNIFKVFSLMIVLWSILDSYLLIKYESWPQLLWFCNIAFFILAIGFYFESPIIVTFVLIGAIGFQIPWVLDFLFHLAFGHRLFGVADYMFGYGFHNIRFYVELNHLLILPFSFYGVKKFGLSGNAWILGGALTIFITIMSYKFSSYYDNINCIFYSCFNEKITIQNHSVLFAILCICLICTIIYILNKLICTITHYRKS